MKMKKILSVILALMMLVALASGCNSKKDDDVQQPSGGTSDQPTGGGTTVDSAEVPKLDADAAKRAEDAYAFIADLKEQASKYNSADAKHRYTLNCHDPAASAAGEFLYAWSDAVLVATEGAVFIDVGVSNAYCSGGTMTTLDDMISGSIDFDWTLPCYFKGYMPLTLAIQNPALGIKNATVASYAMWDLYKSSAELQAEYADDGEVLFVWANNPSPLSYKGTAEITDISEIKGNIRGNNGPAQMFIEKAGGSIYGCPIGDVYTNVSTGVINYLVTDWHGIASFSLYDEGVLNYYLDTNVGCSAYTLMCNENTWAKIESDGYADAIKSVSGDYLLNFVGIWESYEAKGREGATANGGTIYAPSDALAGQLQTTYEAVAEQWIADNGSSAKAVYDKAVELVDSYNAIYG